MVILGAPIDRARQYAADLKLPFPILADPDRSVYHQFALEKTAHIVQQTASLVIDRSGIIRYIRRATLPNTWLDEANNLISIVQRLPK